MSGVEDIECSDTVQIHNGYGCWISNVTAHVGALTHDGALRTYWSVRCTIDHCFIDASQIGIDTYGIESRASAGLLVQNNISRNIGSALMPNGSQGSVWAYNVMTNNIPFFSVILQGLLQHGGHPNMNLYEGNYSPAIGFDNTWGSSAYNVAFRSRAVGYDVTHTASGLSAAFAANIMNRHCASVGNVLGTTGVNTWYEDYGGQTTGCHNNGDVYYFGYYDVGCQEPHDTLARSTCVRAYNWTSATTTNSGINLDGFSSSDIPPSYYLATKPAFFGNLRWPAVDPTAPGYSSSYTNIPAGYRDVYGSDPPAGPVNQAPIVKASATPTNGAPPLAVTFSSAGTSDPEGATLTYSWDFGDGTTSTAANPSHTYNSQGLFLARVTVSDGTNTVTSAPDLRIAVGNQPPNAVVAATPTSGSAPLTVAFTGSSSSDPEGATLLYSWSFGDGGISTTANPSHTYQASGSYAARLVVSDGQSSATNSVTINVIDPSSGLVAAYGFDEGSGSAASDSSGNSNDGTVTGGTWTAGRFGNALSLTAGSMVTVSNSASLALASALTLEAWVNPASSSASWMNLIFKPVGNPANQNPSYVLQGSSPSSTPSFYVGAATANLAGPAALPVGAWSHLAATYDGATMRLYVNGVQVSSRAQTGALPTSADNLTIGGNVFSGQNWNGLIDEVRIYSRALSATEIQNDMTSPVVRVAPPRNLRIVGP